MKHLLSCLVLFSTVSFTTAQTNYSLSFDGSDDYVDMGNVLDISGSLSVSAWVYANENTNLGILIQSGPGGGYYLYINHDGDDGISFQVDDGSPNMVQTPAIFDQWIYIVGVFNSENSLSIYVNGVLMNTVSTSISSHGANGTSLIIGNNTAHSWPFDGNIDEIAIWDVALTQSEIQSYMTTSPTGNETGLVGYWNFNEGSGTTLTDQTSNGNNGTINGATWSTDVPTPPDNNHSLSFDGEDDYVRILDNEILQFESDFSVSLWYKLSVSPQIFQIMVSKQGTGSPNTHGWMYGFSNGANWYVNVENQGGQVQIAGGSYPNIGNLNQWHNGVFVFDQNNTVTLYLDGELLYSINVGDISPSNDVIADLLFGVDREEQKFLNAKMDEISIWNQVLSQEQIQANMSSELSGSEEGLVGYWNFNEGEGATLTDLSGNGNDGTINGATWSDDGAPVQPAFFASLSVGTVDAIANSAVLVPIEVDLMGESISSVEIHFGGFQGHVDFVAVDTSETLVGDAEWNIEINEQEDLLLTLSYGASQISTNGTLMRLKFEVPNNIDTDFVPVVITHAEMDEIEGVIDVVDGGIEIESLLYGDVSQNGNISGYDASLVLKYLVGTETFNETQLMVAEVTQDQTVSALDATAIAQYAIEIIDALPVSDTQNLAGSGTLFINETMFQPGELLEVPVMLTNGDNLLSFELDLSYESEAITLESIAWSDLIGHFTIEENYEAGSIKVAGLGTEPDGQEGVFATVSLFIASSFTDESFDVTINKYRINESDPVEDVVVTFTNSALGIDENTIPTVYALHQNYPNPFNPTTQVNYDLPETGSVQIMIYDLMGRKVRTLMNSEQNAGFKTLQWNATNDRNESVSAGLYLYTIQAGEFRQTKKMVLLK